MYTVTYVCKVSQKATCYDSATRCRAEHISTNSLTPQLLTFITIFYLLHFIENTLT